MSPKRQEATQGLSNAVTAPVQEESSAGVTCRPVPAAGRNPASHGQTTSPWLSDRNKPPVPASHCPGCAVTSPGRAGGRPCCTWVGRQSATILIAAQADGAVARGLKHRKYALGQINRGVLWICWQLQPALSGFFLHALPLRLTAGMAVFGFKFLMCRIRIDPMVIQSGLPQIPAHCAPAVEGTSPWPPKVF